MLCAFRITLGGFVMPVCGVGITLCCFRITLCGFIIVLCGSRITLCGFGITLYGLRLQDVALQIKLYYVVW